jgi:hypothetical protein
MERENDTDRLLSEREAERETETKRVCEARRERG